MCGRDETLMSVMMKIPIIIIATTYKVTELSVFFLLLLFLLYIGPRRLSKILDAGFQYAPV